MLADRKRFDDLRFFTLNIGGPSEIRASRLIDYLASIDADVLVLTETRDNRGTSLLLDWCRDTGYNVRAEQSMAVGERGVAVAHRLPRSSPAQSRTVDLSHRLAAVEVLASPDFMMVGAYVPSRDASATKIARKQTFLKQMQASLESWIRGRPVLFLGDLNIVSREHEPRYSSFRSWEYDAFEEFAALGLVDLFAQQNPGIQAHSWIGRTGDGYRYDYAFSSTCLASRVSSCEYLHEPRISGLSDHAGLLVSLQRSPETALVTDPLALDETLQPV
jgi:exodeoxyribonuclease III